MRDLVKDFVSTCCEHFGVVDPVYDFGSYQEVGQEGEADLRPGFDGHEYVGVDVRPGPGVDRIDDLHNLTLAPKSVGTALMLDTIEHVEYPRKAVDECRRVLVSEGMLLMTSHMKFYIHRAPADYWRFTPEGFISLLKIFPTRIVEFAGDHWWPHTIVGIGFAEIVPDDKLNAFVPKLQDWKVRSYDYQF